MASDSEREFAEKLSDLAEEIRTNDVEMGEDISGVLYTLAGCLMVGGVRGVKVIAGAAHLVAETAITEIDDFMSKVN